MTWWKRRMGIVALATGLTLVAGPLSAQTLGDFRPSWSPDGKKIAFQSTRDGNDELYVLDLASGEVTRLTDHIASDAQPSWSPDGVWIVFASDRSRDSFSGRAAYQLYLMRSDGTGVRRLAETTSADFMPRWSPDGEWIAFLSDRDRELGIFVMRPDGSDVHSLLPPEFEATPGNPSWSPDGRRVAFDAANGESYDIYSVGLDSGDVVNHTQSEESEWYPVWGPRKDWILAGVLTGTREDGTHQIVALNASGGQRSPVTAATPRSGHARDWWPTWSPDGDRIAFASRRTGPWRLYVINADGSGEVALPAR